jgi:hypothetical protein
MNGMKKNTAVNETTVEVLLRDSQTNGPIGARISAQGSDGKYYFPEGCYRYQRAVPYPFKVWGAHGIAPYFYVEGQFQLKLPPGQARITAHHGPAYEIVSDTITIEEGENSHTLRIRRIFDTEKNGWYCGDNHIHSVHQPIHYDIQPELLISLAESEDLNVLNLLDGAARFEGKKVNDHSKPNRLLHYGYEVGHQSVLNVDEPAHEHSGPTLYEQPPEFLAGRFKHASEYGGITLEARYNIDKWVREVGGTVTLGHPFPSSHLFNNYFADDNDFNMVHPEIPFIAALKMVDSYDLKFYHRPTLDIWYRMLNCGIQIPIAAGSDVPVDSMHALSIGDYRTYAHCPDFNYENWLSAIKQGSSFVTNSPLIFLKVNGKLPGSTIKLTSTGEVEVEIEVVSQVPPKNVALVQNGQVIKEWDGEAKLKKKFTLSVSQSCWLAVRIDETSDEYRLFGHTNPVWVEVAEKKLNSSKDAQFFLDWIEVFLKFKLDYSPEQVNPPSELDKIVRSTREFYINQLSAQEQKAFVEKQPLFKKLGKHSFNVVGENLVPVSGPWQFPDGTRGKIDGENITIVNEEGAWCKCEACYKRIAVEEDNFYLLKGLVASGSAKDSLSYFGGQGGRFVALEEHRTTIIGSSVDYMLEPGQWRESSCMLYVRKGVTHIYVLCFLDKKAEVHFKDVELRKIEIPEFIQCRSLFLNW